MGFCTKRHCLLAICLFQIILTIERQIFDFLGYLWIPILLNLFHLIFIIFGFFGAFQLRFKYILSYCTWNTFWLFWNIFLICLYLNIGTLNHQNNFVLKIDPDSSSWWEINGPGCKGVYNTTSTIPQLENITGCVLNYIHVEVFQSSLQGFFTVIGIFLSSMLWKQFQKNPNMRNFKKITKPTSLYSIEFSKQNDSRLNDSDSVEYCNTDDRFQVSISPKPMTPRRVKRRSGMTRSSASLPNSHRNSSKNLLLESNNFFKITHANKINNTSQINDNKLNSNYRSIRNSLNKHKNANIPLTNSLHSIVPSYNQWQMDGYSNLTYQQSSIQSLNDTEHIEDLYNTNNRPASVRSNYSNFHGARILSFPNTCTPNQSSSPISNKAQAQIQTEQQKNRQSMAVITTTITTTTITTTTTTTTALQPNIFLRNGPPAYNLNSTISNTETTI